MCGCKRMCVWSGGVKKVQTKFSELGGISENHMSYNQFRSDANSYFVSHWQEIFIIYY